LTDSDKKVAAVRLYAAGTGLTKQQISEDLSVSERMVRNYLSDVDKQLREERKQQIFDLYMDCHTQKAIAERVGMP